MTTKIGESFGDIVKGLLSLEINTITRPQMRATRMPEVPIALREIACDYCVWLQKRASPIRDVPTAVDETYLKELVAAAKKLHAPEINESDAVLASRIAINAEALVALIPLLAKNPTDPDDIVQFRKIWEIGVESIAMQTVVWIDGDVTHRVRSDLLDSNHTELLTLLHRAGVETSIGMWKELASIVTTIFDAVWTKLT